MKTIKDTFSSLRKAIFSFQGRFSRKKYVISIFLYLLLSIPLWYICMLSYFAAGFGGGTWSLLIGFIPLTVYIISILSVIVRRAHDVNLSGNLSLLFFVLFYILMIQIITAQPSILSIFDTIKESAHSHWGQDGYYYASTIGKSIQYISPLLLLAIFPGTKGPNKYGPDPLEKLSPQN